MRGADEDAREQNSLALTVLGQRLRDRRHQLGLTLKDLANATGLSVPFLSQVENGYGTPSLTTLFALARELGTTPEALLAGPTREDITLVRADAGARYTYSDTELGAVRRVLTGEGEPFSASEYTVAPGADLGDFQASDGRELIHVVAGELLVEIRVDGRLARHALGPGDTIVYSTTDEHRWSILGDDTTRFVHIISPQL